MRLRLLLVSALLLSGCSVTIGGPGGGSPQAQRQPPPPPPCTVAAPPKEVSAEAIVVRGCVATSTGKPVNATVVVAHDAGFLESLALAANIAITGGLVCLAPSPSCGGTDAQGVGAKTDAKGQFRVVIPPGVGAATPGSNRVVVFFPGTGVQAETTFEVRTGVLHRDISLRPFVFWDPRLTVALTPTTATARFATVSEGDQKGYNLVVEDRFGNELDLPFAKDGSISAHLLPPGPGKVRVKHDYYAAYTSAPVPISVPQRSLARGATCVLTKPDGKPYVPYMADDSGCRLTDGDWSSSVYDSVFVCGGEFATGTCLDKRWSVQVDLRKPVTIREVVLVKPGPGVSVEVSADGRRWSALAIAGDAAEDVRSSLGSPAATARYLRVSSDDLSELTEVAVFRPAQADT